MIFFTVSIKNAGLSISMLVHWLWVKWNRRTLTFNWPIIWRKLSFFGTLVKFLNVFNRTALYAGLYDCDVTDCHPWLGGKMLGEFSVNKNRHVNRATGMHAFGTMSCVLCILSLLFWHISSTLSQVYNDSMNSVQTCRSVTFYFMKKLIFYISRKWNFTKYDKGG